MNSIIIKAIVTLIFISSTSVFACLPMPGSEGPLANKLLSATANKYKINLLEAKVDVKNYSHEMIWKFSNSGLDCHDTDSFSADITLTYKDKWDPTSNCKTKVRANLVSSPAQKDGENKIEYKIIQLSHFCGDSANLK